jgi:molybdate transport system permease protein
MTLGYTRSQAFMKTTLPMSKNAILAAAVMCWARALGEFGPILILVGYVEQDTSVMPTMIYMENHVGKMEVALAVSVFMILLGFAAIFIFKRLGGGIRFS